MLCFVVVMQSFIMNSHEVFIHIRQGCFAGTGAIVRLPQCQWSKPDGYGKINVYPQQSTAKQKPCAYFLGYTVNHATLILDTVQKLSRGGQTLLKRDRVHTLLMKTIIWNRTSHARICKCAYLLLIKPDLFLSLYVNKYTRRYQTILPCEGL